MNKISIVQYVFLVLYVNIGKVQINPIGQNAPFIMASSPCLCAKATKTALPAQFFDEKCILCLKMLCRVSFGKIFMHHFHIENCCQIPLDKKIKQNKMYFGLLEQLINILNNIKRRRMS